MVVSQAALYIVQSRSLVLPASGFAQGALFSDLMTGRKLCGMFDSFGLNENKHAEILPALFLPILNCLDAVMDLDDKLVP